MSHARVLLHTAAFAAPLVALYGAAAAFDLRLSEVHTMAGPAVAAAQVAALAGWPLLERYRASAWTAPLLIGLLMAFVTHLLFGPFAIVSQMLFEETPVGDGAISAALLFSYISALVAGIATAPATMAVAVLVHRLRRKELVRVTA